MAIDLCTFPYSFLDSQKILTRNLLKVDYILLMTGLLSTTTIIRIPLVKARLYSLKWHGWRCCHKEGCQRIGFISKMVCRARSKSALSFGIIIVWKYM